MIIIWSLFHQSAKNTQQTTATNENNSDYKEINMHSNKMAFVIVMGIAIAFTQAWAADSAPVTTPAPTEEKTTLQTDSNTSTEPPVEVKIEDIDAPILE